jgi:nicotinate-nucleotide adenylyltransferase
MVKLATQNNPLFVSNDIEIKRDGISYMADTLETLKKQYPNTPLCLLIGFDAFKQFNTWRYHEKILALAHLIVIHRPNVSLDSEAWIQSFLQNHQTKNIQDLHQKTGGKVYLELNPSNDLSSSDVRASKMLEDLPPLVADYISTHGLYQ